MKKILAMFLIFVVGVSLVACGSKSDSQVAVNDAAEGVGEVEEIVREMIGVDVLFADLDNMARAQQNIGKATHLFGKITYIGTESIKMTHIFNDQKVEIPMDTETLVQLNKDEYIAVYAVVDGVTNNRYTFSDGERIEITLMDEYVLNTICAMTTYTLLSEHSWTVQQYVEGRGDTFKMTGDEEITAFMTGNWVNWWNGLEAEFIAKVEYRSDGKCIWQGWDTYMKRVEDCYCSWSVKDSVFRGKRGIGTTVYKLSEDIVIADDCLLIRNN